MKLLSGILAATLTSVVALASANAADMYRGSEGGYKDGPAYVGVNWSGLYVGANAGYGWSSNTDYLDPTGAFGGGQIGYNFQRGNIVFGIEADIQGSGVSDSNSLYKSSLDYFGSIRGRVGYAFDRTLVYGTGGFGYGQVTNSGQGFSGTETQTGWVVGAGTEYKITPVWSAKAEYQYFDLDAPASGAAGPLGFGAGDRTQFNTFRVGVNYFVGGGYDPLK
jgi:outer membrane immunogenic protein